MTILRWMIIWFIGLAAVCTVILAGQAAPLSSTPALSSTPYPPLLNHFFYIPMIGKAPAVQPSPTPTILPGSSNSTTFSIGPGSPDVIPHQVVRTADDRVYFFGGRGELSPVLCVYWTTASGLPAKGNDFSGAAQINNGANILSTAAVYDGSKIIHVLTNAQDGKIIDRPFDTGTNQFKTAVVLGTTGGVVNGNYTGSAGVTGMMDQSGVMHMAFWTSSNHIVYEAYTYNSAQAALTQVSGPTQVDTSGAANHPVLAVSPLDGSVTLAWVSQATNPAKILARTNKAGVWGGVESVSSAPVWTSADAGINIDQGPSLVIGPDGTKYLAYIENWRVTAPYDYGRIHYATNSGSGWTDQYIGSYTHDPALAINSTGQITILGHGYPLNSVCTSIDDLCIFQKNSNGTWATPKLFLAHQGTQTFDTSVSVKWSVVGLTVLRRLNSSSRMSAPDITIQSSITAGLDRSKKLYNF